MALPTLDLTRTLHDHSFAERVGPDRGKLLTCIQCGTCTASCPTAYAMDYSPRLLLRMIQLGLYDEVLKSKTFWLCTTCYSCTVRCPRGISITETFQTLKRMSVAKGVEKKRDSARFYESFMDVVRKNGRMHETLTMAQWMLKTNPFRAFSFASLGLALLSKGKMGLVPHRIRGLDQIEAMFRKAEEIKARQEVNA